MAIFSSLWDRSTISRAGDALAGVTLTTLGHSLPATNPQVLFVTMISKQDVGVNSAMSLLGIRGNASLNTIGFAASSAASAPTVAADVYCAVLHSIIA